MKKKQRTALSPPPLQAGDDLSLVAERDIRRAVLSLTNSLLSYADGSYDTAAHLLHRLLLHPKIKGLTDFASQLQNSEVDRCIVNRIRGSITALKKNCRTDHERIAYEALLVAVAPSPEQNIDAFAKRLNTRWHTLKSYQNRRTLLDEGLAANGWYMASVKPRRDALVQNSDLYAKYIAFFKDTRITNVNPSVNAPVTRHMEGKLWHKGPCGSDCEVHPRHELQVTLTEAYGILKGDSTSEYEGLAAKCSWSTFVSLVPWWVKKPKSSTCNCVYHTRAHLLLKAFRHAMKHAHKDCTCPCAFCGGGQHCKDAFDNMTMQTIFDDALCNRQPNPHRSSDASVGTSEIRRPGLYHDAKCVLGTCSECKPAMCPCPTGSSSIQERAPFPVSTCFSCPLHHTTDPVFYKDFVPVKHTENAKNEAGHYVSVEKTRTVKKEVESTRKEFGKYFQEHLRDYLPHRHAAMFNAEQFDAMVDALKDHPEQIMILMDFGMNYSHVHRDEDQGEFWMHVQTTVLPMVVYRVVEGVVWAESWVFLSDDRSHDNDFVRHCVKQLVGELVGEQGVSVKKISFWSDGCAAQFKLAKQMAFISQKSLDLPDGTIIDLDMNHYFFCSCHGKGPSDAETAVVKTKGRRLEFENDVYMAFSEDFFREVKGGLESLRPPPIAKKERHTLRKRYVRFVNLGDAPRVNKDYNGIEGFIAMNHSFRSTSQDGTLFIRWLPCACSVCFGDDRGDCKLSRFNTEAVTRTICATREIQNKTLKEHLDDRHEKYKRRLLEMKGGCDGVNAAFLSSDPKEPYWLGCLLSGPRHLKKGDVINQRMVGRGSKKLEDEVVPVFWYTKKADLKGGPLVYTKPSVEKCNELTGCSCGKWHPTLTYFHAIRPPLIPAESFSSTTKDPLQHVLPPGFHQQITATMKIDKKIEKENGSQSRL